MKQYRLALLGKEFSFLFEVAKKLSIELRWAESIAVARGDKMLLAKKGMVDVFSDQRGNGHDDYTKYFAIKGEDVTELGVEGSGNEHNDVWELNCDTNGEQLFALGINPDFIVECVKNDPDDFHIKPSRFSWTIYKMSKFDLAGYYQQQIDRAAEQIKREIAAAWEE